MSILLLFFKFVGFWTCYDPFNKHDVKDDNFNYLSTNFSRLNFLSHIDKEPLSNQA